MFSLTENRNTSRGLYCGSDGLYLGRSPLIEYCNGRYKARTLNEVAALLAAARSASPSDCPSSPPIFSMAISRRR